jgi:hypothetical protein
MNVTPHGTIAVPLAAVKREIKYATKLGARSRHGAVQVESARN